MQTNNFCKLKKAIGLECIHSPAIHELMRGIRENLNEMTGIHESERSAMALGLAHSLSRYKLKFSPDKVDTMIVQVRHQLRNYYIL